MQRVSTAGPDYVWSRLEVSGAPDRLCDFMSAACGPGFIDWNIDWYEAYDEAFGRTLLGGAPSLGAASAVAHKLTDRTWRIIGEARRTAELDPTRCPFDLNALIPVPAAVLRQGYRGAGEAWLWQHWGVGAPLRRVTREVVQRPVQTTLPLAAVYRFLSEDWAPGLAIGMLRGVWPDLRFALSCQFLEAARQPNHAARAAAPASEPRRTIDPKKRTGLVDMPQTAKTNRPVASDPAPHHPLALRQQRRSARSHAPPPRRKQAPAAQPSVNDRIDAVPCDDPKSASVGTPRGCAALRPSIEKPISSAGPTRRAAQAHTPVAVIASDSVGGIVLAPAGGLPHRRRPASGADRRIRPSCSGGPANLAEDLDLASRAGRRAVPHLVKRISILVAARYVKEKMILASALINPDHRNGRLDY